MEIKGVIKKDRKTKNLIKRLKPGDIALISHRDLDEIAAMGLIEKKVKCIINTEKSISGRYPNQGPRMIINAGIPIFETSEDIFDKVEENEIIEIHDGKITYYGGIISVCEQLDKNKIEYMENLGVNNLQSELDQFIENTLEYAKKEKDLLIGNIDVPEITKIKGKHVLIVVRGKDYKEDLAAIQNYITEMKPILIGVDGGGDALLEFGFIPDILIGDMDSVSDRCIKLSKKIIVHAYVNGKAPGLERIRKLGLDATIFPSPGTSEDIALLLAYNNNADLIVAVGTHTNMIDFLEKGRKGMSSTLLVRLKVGNKLIDAKGVNKLYRSNLKLKYIVGLGLSALIPIIIISLMSPPIKELIRLLRIRIRILFGL